MKAKHYPFALIISMCVVFGGIAYSEWYFHARTSTETQTAQIAFSDLPDPYAKIDALTQKLQDNIAKLDSFLAEYERLKQENQVLQDYIDGFWDFMNEQYDFEGHQEKYMERVK